ncbi:MAG: hypothetical protein PSV35_04425 [bacterium]|nr:hypothetical protein [bacterium]
MNKYLLIAFIGLGLTSCNSKDEQYYRSNPKELQAAIKRCPNEQPQGLTCNQLNDLAQRLSGLAYDLQSNPQGFGQKILALQQTIANQKIELINKPTPELKASLEKNSHDLVDFLAVVKWLESPES